MKSAIYSSIGALLAIICVDDKSHVDLPEPPKINPKVYTTEELIEGTEMHLDYMKLKERQDSVSYLVKEVVKDKIVDSSIVKRDSI